MDVTSIVYTLVQYTDETYREKVILRWSIKENKTISIFNHLPNENYKNLIWE